MATGVFSLLLWSMMDFSQFFSQSKHEQCFLRISVSYPLSVNEQLNPVLRRRLSRTIHFPMYVLCMAVVLLPVCAMNNTNRMGLSRQPCRHLCSQDIVLERPPFILIRAPGGILRI